MRSMWLLLLLQLLTAYCGASSALRCYTCVDCDEQSEVNQLEICSVPSMAATGLPAAAVPSPSPSPSPSPAPAPSATAPAAAPAATAPAATVPAAAPAATAPAATVPAAAPAAIVPAAAPAATVPAASQVPAAAAPVPAPAAASESEDEEDYESEEDDSAPPSTLGIMPAASNVPATAPAAASPGTVAAPARPSAPAAAPAPAPAAAAAAGSDDGEEEEEEEDYDERHRRKRSVGRQGQSTQTAVCYIASLKNNGTEITNRGCTIVTDDNQTDACHNVFKGWDVVGCQLCESNGCNSPINAAVLGQWHSGTSRLSAQTALGLALLALAGRA